MSYLPSRRFWFRRFLLIGGLLIATTAVFTAAMIAQPSLRKKVRDLQFAAAQPLASYDEKMSLQLGISYEYLMFVRSHTAESAVILIPPTTYQPPYVGDKVVVRYFIYPRTAVHEDEASRATHVMLIPDWRPAGISIPPMASSASAWGLLDVSTGQIARMAEESK